MTKPGKAAKAEVAKAEKQAPATKPAADKAAEASRGVPPLVKPRGEQVANLLGDYIKAYAHVNKFYVTSDDTVFLEEDKQLAVEHQRDIDNGQQPFEYVVGNTEA